MVGAASSCVVGGREDEKAGLVEGAKPDTAAIRRTRRVVKKVDFIVQFLYLLVGAIIMCRMNDTVSEPRFEISILR